LGHGGGLLPEHFVIGFVTYEVGRLQSAAAVTENDDIISVNVYGDRVPVFEQPMSSKVGDGGTVAGALDNVESIAADVLGESFGLKSEFFESGFCGVFSKRHNSSVIQNSVA
jgi:hypothetical protein